jgi:hypothetical protein
LLSGAICQQMVNITLFSKLYINQYQNRNDPTYLVSLLDYYIITKINLFKALRAALARPKEIPKLINY